ncbi:uncharacterized protein LOC113272679 [Papaver somniferum]|uniref:uncharacterized protein LOC113272679 n=1 Tax=Papaver somniferum TaxID=3469 RepID=UPI000E702687|nr:uncharacterized protein LOC113272679 [Papaver somniferum]
MRLLSWNVQGIGNPLTKDHLDYLCQYYKPDVVFLAETKSPLSRMELHLKKPLFHDWFIVSSVGIAKGLAIAWYNNVEMKLVSSKFNVCHFELKIGELETLVTCVYGAIDANDRINQWTHIAELAKLISKPWILIRDLNVILDPKEKQGGNQTSSSSKSFIIQTIDSMGLQDARYEGAPFTWSNNRKGEANICERIDRALTSVRWAQSFSDTKVTHLPRVGSDHMPILLDSSPQNYRIQKPFRCLRSWLTHSTLPTVVEASWKLHSAISGETSLSGLLKLLSSDLAHWNTNVFGNIHKNIRTINNRIDSIHRSGNIAKEIDKIKNLQAELGNWYKIKNDYYHQLSRDKFFKEYDQNTEYFHASASNRKRINAINSLREPSGLWLSDRDQINSLFLKHFQQIGTSQNSNFDFELSTIINPCISSEENASLTAIPTKDEIWKTISNMNQWGAPGPDGFQPGFLKANWDFLGKDTINKIQDFFRSAILDKDLNHSFITLISKISIPKPQGTSDLLA